MNKLRVTDNGGNSNSASERGRDSQKMKPNQTSVKYLQGCHVALINLAYTWIMYCSMVHFLHMFLSLSA